VNGEALQELKELLSRLRLGKRDVVLPAALRCRRCGRKLTVKYTGKHHAVLRYSCARGRLDSGQPNCIAFGGILVDEAIGREVFRVIQPGGLEAAKMASEEEARKQDDVLATLHRDLEAARYNAASRSEGIRWSGSGKPPRRRRARASVELSVAARARD
jgi:hypothetical protein